jgi:GTP-binding protein LepA
MTNGNELLVESPKHLPPIMQIDRIGEPIVKATIHTPQEYLGAIIKLCEDKRGRQKNMQFVGTNRVLLTYEMPLAEIIMDFFDKLKTSSRGYASLDYEIIGFKDDDLVKVDILVNGDPVDALACIMHRSQAEYKGRQLCEKLKDILPRQQFEIPIQAAIGARVVARETIRSMGKNVTAKCYGGDISRKRKLLDKQKEGKKRMKQFGKVEIPQDAFMAILKVE